MFITSNNKSLSCNVSKYSYVDIIIEAASLAVWGIGAWEELVVVYSKEAGHLFQTLEIHLEVVREYHAHSRHGEILVCNA